ncbi:MAG: AsmA-like C-terminal domain-containing protein [Desulfomonilaceae bacterium]|nr:AsmA-like C-terminal domain-containing protein [Desulfomonilaceae bacterium]
MGTTKQSHNPSTRSRVVKQIARKSITVLLLLVVLLVGFAVYVRLGLDGERAARLIIPWIESAMGRQVSYSSATLVWTSLTNAKLAFTAVNVGDGGDTVPVLSIPDASFEIDVKSALVGSFTVNRAVFAKPTATVRKGLELPQMGSPGGSPIGRFILGRLSVKGLDVTDARIVSILGDAETTHRGSVMSRLTIHAKDLTKDGAGSFDAHGELSTGDRKGLFEFSGTLPTAPLGQRGRRGQCRLKLIGCPLTSVRAVGLWFGHDLPVADGSVSLTLNLTGEAERLKASGAIELSRVLLSWDSVFGRDVPVEFAVAEFDFERIGRSVHIDLTKAGLPGLSISGEARLGEIFSEDPSLTIGLREADIDLKKIFPLVPLNLLAREDRNRLTGAGLEGRVRVTGGAWTGTISDLKKRSALLGIVALEAFLDGVSGFVPGLGLPVERAGGMVHVNSNKVLFKGISLTVGSSPIVLNGSITNLKAVPTADLFISMKAQAQDLYPLLTSTPFAGTVKPWLDSVVEPKGGVSVTLDVKGDLRRPGMKGRVTLEGFQCDLVGFPLSLNDFNGSVRFRGTQVAITELEGIIGDSPAFVKGSVTGGSVDLSCHVKIAPSDAGKLCRLPTGWAVSRDIPTVVDVKGKIPNLDFSLKVDLKSTGLNFGSFLTKRSGTPLRIEASGNANHAGILVEEASLIFPGNRIAADAKIRREGESLISVNLPPKGIPTRTLTPFVHPSFELQPGGRVEGDATIRIGKTGKPDLDARLQFTHVSFRIPGFHKRTVGMVASIRQQGDSFHLSVDQARNGSSVFSGSLTVTGSQHPKVDTTLVFSFLDTTDFTAPPGFVSDVTWGEWIRANPAIRFLARSSGKGFVKVEKGKTPSRPFGNFRANIEGKDGLLKVPNWQVNIADGIIRGSAVCAIRANTQVPLVLDLQADQLRMERVMLSDPEWLRVEGDVVVNGKLQWNLSSSRANNGVYKTGNIEVRVNDGTVNRFDILSKVFSLINLGSILRGRLPDLVQQGLPFQSLTWDMDVLDTKWKFKDMKLVSDAARISASGMYFSDQDRIDFQVDVSPLVGFDQIFSGLFGNLVTRNGKILTTTFRVRGLSATPDVRLMPFENFKPSR